VLPGSGGARLRRPGRARPRHVHRRRDRPLRPDARLVRVVPEGVAQPDRAPERRLPLQLQLRADHLRRRRGRHRGGRHLRPGEPRRGRVRAPADPPGLGTESHDISFNADGTRAYSAALSQTVIIDTEDPADPSVITSFVDPAINVEHQANPITIEDPILGARDFLIVEDEVAGASPTGQCPNGGVHVYDITDETDPVKVGYWNISDVGLTADGLGTCTAHVFELHEEEQLMTIAYYNGGVRVVDLSGLVGVALGQAGIGMRELASLRFDDSDTWAVKAPWVSRDEPFYIFGNDQARGFDVYRVDLTDPADASTTQGEWLGPAEILARTQAFPLSTSELLDRALRCKLGAPVR
jgi:hypothetical protein